MNCDSSSLKPLLENDATEMQQINNVAKTNSVETTVDVGTPPSSPLKLILPVFQAIQTFSKSKLVPLKLTAWDISTGNYQEVNLKVTQLNKDLYEGKPYSIEPSKLNQLKVESNFMTAIHFASLGGNIENLKNIIKKTENINAITIEGYNALHVLLKYGDSEKTNFEECFKILLEKVDYNKTDFDNKPPIIYAIQRKLINIIKIFLEINKDGSKLDEVKICDFTYKKKKMCFYVLQLGIKMIKFKHEDFVNELSKILKSEAFITPITKKHNNIQNSKCNHELEQKVDIKFVQILKNILIPDAFINANNDNEQKAINQNKQNDIDVLLLKIRDIIKNDFFVIKKEAAVVEHLTIKNNCKDSDRLKQLKQFLKEKNEEQFVIFPKDINSLQKEDDDSKEDFNLLQLAVFNNLELVAEMLINIGYSAYDATEKYPIQPIEICIKYNYSNIFKLLIKKLKIEKNENIDEAYIIFRKICHVNSFEMADSFLKHALDKLDKNKLKEHLPSSISNGMVLTLSEYNIISLADKDTEGKLYITVLASSSLKRHIQNCITSGDSHTEDGIFSMSNTFNYESIMPTNINNDNYSEIEIISYIAEERPDLLSYLYQPFMKALVYLKWHMYRKYYLVSIIYNILFCIGLLFYITFNQNTDWILIILFIMTLVIKLFKIGLFYANLKTKFHKASGFYSKFECIYKIIDMNNISNFIIIINTTILFCIDTKYKENCNVINLILSAYNLVYSIGNHPELSTRLRIFHTVSWTYITIILLYFPIILSFGIAFRYMIHEENQETNEDKHFNNILSSIFATLTMMVGEVGFTDSNTSIFTRFIFTIFLLFIVIIFMSLMNALAVSDTKKVQDEANFNALQSQLTFIRCIEIFASFVNSKEKLKKYFPKYYIKHTFLFQDSKKLKVIYNSKGSFLEIGDIKVGYLKKHDMRTVNQMKPKENKEAANKKLGENY